jgi:hAT family C-terminal dimerisation region
MHTQQNRRRFPTIFRLAMDVLPIQGSAVPCECVFSSSAVTDAARRNKISPELMEALQVLKFALKKHRLVFTQGMAKEAELKVLEEADSRPEDADSFARELHKLLNSV